MPIRELRPSRAPGASTGEVRGIGVEQAVRKPLATCRMIWAVFRARGVYGGHMFASGRRSARRSAAQRVARPSQRWSEEHSAQMFAFEMIMLRELEQDSMTWQTPAIALTAQSFLLTIALDESKAIWSRGLTAALGVVIAVLSIQLLSKHIYLTAMDRAQLRLLESDMGLPAISQRKWDDPRVVRPKQNFWARRSSAVWWRRGMEVFAVANVIILVLVAYPALAGWN